MASKMNTLRPLREYISDKKELIDQMFSCIEEHQLKKMIPDVLKEAKLDDIKAECLVELLGMSRKRILGILEGKELDESSDSLELSDISDDELDVKAERKSPDRTRKKKQHDISKGVSLSKKSRVTSSPESEQEDENEESDDNEETISKKSKPDPKRKKKALIAEAKDSATSKAVKGSKKKVEEASNDNNKQKNVKATNLDLDLGVGMPKANEEGKNLLEILELEMRARAIRSLIEREEKKNATLSANTKPSTSLNKEVDIDNDPDAVIVVEENVADQIDLTIDDSDVEELSTVTEKIPGNKVITGIESDKNEMTEESDKSKPTVKKQKEFRSRFNDCPDLKQPNENSDEVIPKNWTERWLESNEVQNVMKTTKVLTNLKKRLINVSKQKALLKKNLQEQTEQEDTQVEGTVDEYSQLPSNRKENETIDDQQENEINKNISLQNIVDESIYSLSLDKLPVSSEYDVKFQETDSNDASITVPTEMHTQREVSETDEKAEHKAEEKKMEKSDDDVTKVNTNSDKD